VRSPYTGFYSDAVGHSVAPRRRKAVTLLTPDAQSPRFLSDHPRSTSVAHSMPALISSAYASSSMQSSSSSSSNTGLSGKIVHTRDSDFASHPRDLATGGLKALTAKREVPSRLDRRPSGNLPEIATAPRSYTFALVILACIIVMLISGGVVLFMLVQP
jgi:hypothetical protein